VERACRAVVVVLAGLYILALALFAIGTFGLFGNKLSPLAGVYLLPLGLPWNMMLDPFPESAWPWLAASAPLVNLVLRLFVCHFADARK